MSFLWVFAALLALLALLAVLALLIPRVFGSKSRAPATVRVGVTAPAVPETADPEAPARPAGWYSDPGHPAFVRWFDGTAWTDRFEPAGRHSNADRGMPQSH
ncbi:DUF2510 domain-containing protein [Rhodococcus zopfii]|uniref:DUF2510 domain-containing protein n=1 Tax=Rhodococcus zopfii TaxID=43772 RepID=UPI0035286EA0